MVLSEQREIQEAILRLNIRVLGFAFGVLLGGGLFVATNLLVLKGGAHVGAHLALLRNYFPGYSVTFSGSLVGLLYGFTLGYLIGAAIAYCYNRFARP